MAVFPFGSTFGAYGTLSMDLVQAYERSHKVVIRRPSSNEYSSDAIVALNKDIQELLSLAKRDIAEEGLDTASVNFQLDFTMCYGMQRQTLEVLIPVLELRGQEDLDAAFKSFDATYGETFGDGARSPETGAEVHLVRLSVIGPMPKIDLTQSKLGPVDAALALVGERKAYWSPAQGAVDTPVYRINLLAPGMSIDGPALVESEDTTCAVTPDRSFRIDGHGTSWLIKK